MTQLLGYVAAGTRGDTPEGVDLIEHHGVFHVMDRAMNQHACKRLEKVQKCYRAFEAFLPHLSGTKKMQSATTLALLEKVARHGQLSFRLAYPRGAPTDTAHNGRTYLAACRARRKAREAWQDAAETAMHVLADHLPARDRLLVRRNTAMTLDLLVESDTEPGLRDLIAPAVLAARQAAPWAHFAVSGLWAPMSFARAGMCTNE
ncbi:MAG: hypothetical protein AAGA06_00125 [Pseudomonadota bacterium]